jgi:hypothetical protein
LTIAAPIASFLKPEDSESAVTGHRGSADETAPDRRSLGEFFVNPTARKS